MTSVPAAAHEPGALVVGRYRLGVLLGEGTRKRVHLGEDTFLDRVVAVLSLKPGHDGPCERARLRREATVTARLGDHPAVVAVHDLVEEDGMPFVVVQHLDGGALSDRLREGPLPLAEALSVARDVATALEHAHAGGVVHRDVKPANVWLTSRGTAVLGDFGLAAQLDDPAVPALQGTAEWMAPEQAIGAPPDPRSDLYSLGALLYALLCGRPPHTGDGVVGLLEQALNVVPEPPSALRPGVPPGLDALVQALLAKDPQDRPASAHDVVVGLSLVQMEVRPAGSSGGDALIGRTSELALLGRALHEAGRGGAALTVVSGEAGVGKTRVVLELAGRARADGWSVLAGRCFDGDGAPPFWPWTQVLRAALREHGADRLRRLAGSSTALLAHILPELAEHEPAGDPSRFALFDAVASLLRGLSAPRPVLVVLDDLHWADPDSFALVGFLARHLNDAPVAVVACQRPDDQGPPRLPRGAGTVDLGGLPREDSARLVELHSGVRPDDALLEELQSRTDGNPFFLGELVRLLSAEQRLGRDGGLLDSTALLPDGIREVLQRRVRLVSAECAGVLGAAAVLGREISLEVLQSVAGAPRMVLVDLLEEAVRARLLAALPGVPVRYRFAHALVQEFLYEGLPPAQRMDLHARSGAALLRVHAAAPEARAAELAHHFVRADAAGDPMQALVWSARAGRAAAAAAAHEEAAAHLARALAVLESCGAQEEGGELDRGALLLALGEAQCRAGDTDAGRDSFHLAADQGLLRGDATLLAQAALGYGVGLGGFGFVAHADGVLLSLLEEALNDLGDQDSPLRVRVMARLATELYFTPFRSRRNALAEQAVAMAARLGDPAGELVALYSHTSATLGPDAPDARPTVERMLALSEAVGDVDMQFRAHSLRLDLALSNGDIELAEAQVLACRRLAEVLRRPLHAWQVGVYEAMLHFSAGRLEACRERAEDALRLGQRGHRDMALVMYGAQQLALHWALGRLPDVLEAVRSYADSYPHAPAWRCALAFCLVEVDHPDEARHELEALAARDFADLPRDGNFLTAVTLLAQVAARLGDRRRCALLEALLAPYVDRQVVFAAGAVAYASAALPLGLLRAAQGDTEGALQLLARAQQDHERRGARVYVVTTAVEQVRLLLQRGTAEDNRAAAALLAAALPLARDVGMPRAVDRLRSLAGVLSGHALCAEPLPAGPQGRLPDTDRTDGEAVTILLTDVAGSTVLTERLGERAVHALLLEHRRTVATAARLYGGIMLKSLGDGALCAFPDAASALRCAAWLQRSAQDAVAGVRLRMAVHTGPVLRQGESMYGRSMIMAFRLAEHAGPGEVLVSAAARHAAENVDLPFGEPEPLALKGFTAPALVHRLRLRG